MVDTVLVRKNISSSSRVTKGGQAEVFLGSAWDGGERGVGPVGQPYAIKVCRAHRGRRPLTGLIEFQDFLLASKSRRSAGPVFWAAMQLQQQAWLTCAHAW